MIKFNAAMKARKPDGSQFTIKAGDTLSEAKAKALGVSLDMMVAAGVAVPIEPPSKKKTESKK